MIFIYERVVPVFQLQQAVGFQQFEMRLIAVVKMGGGVFVSAEFRADVVNFDAEPCNGIR